MAKITRSLVFLFMSLGLFSCGSDDSGEEETSDLILYKIDYTTQAFEGGISFSPRRIASGFNTQIPLEIDKEPATMDTDGSVVLIYEPTLDQVFQGALSLEGEANIFFPSFIEPGDFLELNTPVAFPSGTQVQSIDGDHSQAPIADIWSAISRLGLTEFLLNNDTQIGLFLYQPSEDPGFSENWDWILMLYNP